MTQPIVIVGAGQAAASFANRHHQLGSDTPLLIIGEEPKPPYERPPLSKGYLKGDLDAERLLIRPAQWYVDQGFETRFGVRIASIDRANRRLQTAYGETIEYSKLLLATGSHARQLPAAIGGNLDGVYTLRNFADVNRMAPEFIPGRRLLIVGGGYIGLEAAAVARQLGLRVTLLEMADRILQRVAAEQTSAYFRDLHRGHGVDLREATALKRLVGEDGRINGAELESGEIIDADFALIGIGGSPATELAKAAGLECENGILVDAQCRTPDPDIYAAGDCANFERNGQRIRLESVQNAADQGDLVARVLAGEVTSYYATPWFWSDQYDCMLQIAGLNLGYDRCVTRPGSKDGALSIWYYAGDQLIAVDAMNEPRSYAFGRKLIEMGKHPTPDQVADPATDLKALVKG